MPGKSTAKSRILWVDDDEYFIQPFLQKLQASGFNIISEMTATSGLERFLQTRYRFCCVILDMAMPPGSQFEPLETYGGHQAGLSLARRVHSANKDIPIIAFTQSQNLHAEESFMDMAFPYLIKAHTSVNEFFDTVNAAINRKYKKTVRAFVVHGHDHAALLELKDYIQNTLGLEEPVVLRDEPHCGRTVIEKFEECSGNISIVFAIFSPDDQTFECDQKRRARQNVIFELGYFYGKLQRRDGRIILLHKGSLELPSDIAGIGYIDISSGVQAAGEQIRRELRKWL